MITDTPRITQRSIIAYSVVSGDTLPGDWYGCELRRGVDVDSLTTATVRIVNGGSRVTTYGFATNCRAVVSGTSIAIECKLDTTDSPGVYYGVSATGTLTVEVTTAGNVAAGIAGATKQFVVNVLVLDHDWPYAEQSFLMFAQGESVDSSLGTAKHAKGDWYTHEVGTGYGLSASGGQKIVGNTKVNGEYVDSGLILHNQDGRIWISGTAARPGVYRIYFDFLSTVQGYGQGSPVYHPFEGGYGESEVIIWIYRDWLPGDLVLLLPALTHAEDKYKMSFDAAPDWSGLGSELIGVAFAREIDGGAAIWRGAKIYRYNGAVSSAYHYLIRCENATWKLYGKFTDSDTAPAPAAMTILATAAARGFTDETPPKSTWSAAGLFATGDARWYLPEPEAGQTDNSGWYAYAGTVTITPPGENAETVTAEVYARQPHIIRQYSGWNLGETSGTAARYLANVGGTWYITSDLSDLSDYSDITACPEVLPQRADGHIAIPFCPAKKDDFGVVIDVPPEDEDDPEAESSSVIHSLSNRFAGSGDLALFMDGIAGAMWKRYPIRRLLSLFAVGATVTMNISSSKEIEEYSEVHNEDGNNPEHDDMTGVPSIREIKRAPGQAITQSKVENWAKTQTTIRASASGSVSVSLSYALWSNNFPKYLEAIAGRSSSGSGGTATYSHNRTVQSKQSSESKTYKVGEVGGSGGQNSGGSGGQVGSGGIISAGGWTVTNAGATLSRVTWQMQSLSANCTWEANTGADPGRSDPDEWGAGTLTSNYITGDSTENGDSPLWGWPYAGVRGDGRIRVGRPWDGTYRYGTDGHFTYTWDDYMPPAPDDVAYTSQTMTATATAQKTETGATVWNLTSGGWISSTRGQNPPSFSQPEVTITSGGIVTMTVNYRGETITSSGQGSVSISRQSYDEDTYGNSASGYELTASAEATYEEPPEPPEPPEPEEVVYVAEETLGGSETATVGSATTASGSNKKAHGTASVFFGEGRECNWQHRSICAAAGGEGGMSVDFSATDQQRQIATTTTHGGLRRRGGPRDQWEYVSGDAQTWGTTTTTTATDEDLPETLTDSLAHGGTFHTGVIALIFNAVMGNLSARYSTTNGSAEGHAFGYRQNPQTGDDESANIPSVSGSWTHISGSSTNGPDTSETRGNDVSASIDLSGEIDGDEWEQWGYSHSKTEHTTSVSVQIAISNSDFYPTGN